MASEVGYPPAMKIGALSKPLLINVLLMVVSCVPTKNDPNKSQEKSTKQMKSSQDVNNAYAEAVLAKGPNYKPRTKHFLDNGKPKYTNHLIKETSPYLLQHAHNPVDWHPWGEEAFAKAKKENKPIFLSIGYSTCHWCHVMEEESFENEDIAEYLNEHYIAIKVDREERPDIDSTYMAAVQAMGISGGWPLNVWLNQDKEPFYAGTYFPPTDGLRGGRKGFLTVLTSIHDAFVNKAEMVKQSSEEIVRVISAQITSEPSQQDVDAAQVISLAQSRTISSFDETWGGVKAGQRQTKFPSSLPIRFLLRAAKGNQKEKLESMVDLTLNKMVQGGMYDQIGGGFHRYSTDVKWQIPHFEKMLYDNALLTVAYTEAYQATGEVEFKEVAIDTLNYVAREMQHPEGGFYSATDADSVGPDGHREEGYYFSWTPKELKETLEQPEELNFALSFFDINHKGNFEGRSVPTKKASLKEFARKNKADSVKTQKLYQSVRAQLLAKRSKRPAPGLDDKILTAWNGLMISAFAKASMAFPEKQNQYAKRAIKAGHFILGHMRDGERLFRTFRQDEAKIAGFLQDYTFVIGGFLDLFEMSQNPKWLREAIALDKVVNKEFEDKEGGYFLTSSQAEKVLIRQKSVSDGAIPSGGSVQLLNLYKLYQLTVDPVYLQRAKRFIQSLASSLTRAPTAFGELLVALDFESSKPLQIVLVSPDNDPVTSQGQLKPFVDEIHKRFLPSKVIMQLRGQATAEQLAVMPWLKEKRALDGKTTAYVCQDTRCQLPAKTLQDFKKQLAAI